MIEAAAMKVGVAVPDSEIIGRAAVSQCSQCGSPVGPFYPSGTVMVVRHWKINSKAGTWRWYCEDHFARYKPWRNDHLAPPELR